MGRKKAPSACRRTGPVVEQWLPLRVADRNVLAFRRPGVVVSVTLSHESTRDGATVNNFGWDGLCHVAISSSVKCGRIPLPMWWKHIGIGLICRILSEAEISSSCTGVDFWGDSD
jgi:hypothetical protein